MVPVSGLEEAAPWSLKSEDLFRRRKPGLRDRKAAGGTNGKNPVDKVILRQYNCHDNYTAGSFKVEVKEVFR
jgi:hypothetical protein